MNHIPRFFYKAFGVTLALSCAFPLLGQHKPSARPNRFAASPFDTSLSTLPPFYVGQDASAVFAALQAHRASFSKSEYETSAAFAERLDAFTANRAVIGMRPSDLFAFSVKPEISYDADASELKVTIAGDYLSSPLNVAWSSLSVPVGSYVGSNAFGVKKLIHKVKRTNLNLSVDTPDWFLASYTKRVRYGVSPGFVLPVNAADAERFSQTLRVLLVGSLRAPFVTRDIGGSEPTITDPVDLTTIEQTVHVQLRAVWLYDVRTGSVVAKFDAPRFERDWPVRATLSCSACSAVGLDVELDGTNNSDMMLGWTSTEPAYLHAKTQIRLSMTTYVRSEPELEVTSKGQRVPWSCTSKYSYGSARNCSLTITAASQ